MNNPEQKSPGEEYARWEAPETGTQADFKQSARDQELSRQIEQMRKFQMTGDLRKDTESFFLAAGFHHKIPELQAGRLDPVRYLESIRQVTDQYLSGQEKVPVKPEEFDSPGGYQAWRESLALQNQIIDQILTNQKTETKGASMVQPESLSRREQPNNLDLLREMSRITDTDIRAELTALEEAVQNNPDDSELKERLKLLRQIAG